ncbi:MAG: tRNA ((37)-N6)-threonylcarbamoyltransferase complex dimerization subunit type 1 TsaB [Actinomycetota bacterium]
MLLAIDTSAGTSAAVYDGGALKSFVLFEDPFGHAENIGLAIAQALDQAGISPGELTAVAIGRGPAPYTGLRVGMAAGTSLAEALNLPLHGIITLDAVAFAAGLERCVVVADAKRKEFFVAAYDRGARLFGPEVVGPEGLTKFSDYQEITQVCDAQMIGRFAAAAIARGEKLDEISALYLRSPDVAPSPGKKVSGGN